MSASIRTEFLALQELLAGRYSIERELGRGGMGIVLLARDVALDRPVAIKLLPPHLATQPAERDRFLQEARTAAGLAHPNIVPIHLVEARGELVFFVMGFVDGETLRDRVERAGPLPPRLAMKLLQEVAWALGYAHQRGVIHRDVKPDNIMIERATERALVTDFGIALGTRAAESAGGPVVGTARFMSPEQACGEPVDARSDLYSLGATFFYALTGRAPFEGTNLAAILVFQLVVVARRLLKDGYAFGDIRAALLAEAQVQQEEAEVIKQRRLFRRLDSLWYRVWAGRAGRSFFRLAGVGLKATARPALPSVERTELVLGRSALSAYKALPEGERRQARDLPGVVGRLETGAEALRGRGDTGESLTEAVAALERLRLALVKRQSGVGSASDLTLALERAKAIGDHVERRLAAAAEVQALLE